MAHPCLVLLVSLTQACLRCPPNLNHDTLGSRGSIKHTAKEEAKARGEAPASADKDQSLSKPKIDQMASNDKQVSTHVNFNVPQYNIITNTARIDAALQTIKYALGHGAKSVVLRSHLGRPNGDKNKSSP